MNLSEQDMAAPDGPRQPLCHELYAIRYATRAGRRPDFFLGGDAHDTSMDIDYFLWVAVHGHEACVIDTGFTREMAIKRQRVYLHDPMESLRLLGIEPDSVRNVVLTHLHYDHAGNFEQFPQAVFHVQDKEMQFATGRHMLSKYLNAAYEVDEIAGLLHKIFSGSVHFHDGDGSVASGITVHHVGGHTMGLQFVRVFTRRGWVVLASDASHFYENFLSRRPIGLLHDVGATIQAFDRLAQMAGCAEYLIPGHDPLVMSRYPAAGAGLEGRIVRLDVTPLEP